jgi:hypothetical protein
MIAQSSDTDVSDGSFKFDKRVSLVVWVGWAGFAASTEIGIVADGTLVTISLDICGRALAIIVAKRAIAVDAVVACFVTVGVRQSLDIIERFVDGNESMARMNETGIGNASRAEIPIWAIETFVTNTIDILVTPITNSIVSSVTARSEEGLRNHVKIDILNGRSKSVLGVVAMFQTNVAWDAQIVIITGSASDEILFGQFLNARVAGAGSNIDLGLFNESSLGSRESLWLNGLSGASDDLAILNITLNHPMPLATTENTVFNAAWAEIEITIITSAAVIVFICDGIGAVVAID